jgi:hypothetical protein
MMGESDRAAVILCASALRHRNEVVVQDGRAKLAVGVPNTGRFGDLRVRRGKADEPCASKKGGKPHVSVRRDPPFLPKPLNAPLFPTNEAGGQSLVWDRKNPDAE